MNKSEFVTSFRAEAQESIERLNHGLIQLEKEPNQPQLIAELFRLVHSLKGSARMLDFNEIQDVAHRLEDLLGGLRDQKTSLNNQIAENCFQAVDRIKTLLDSSETTIIPATKITVEKAPKTQPYESIRIPIQRIDMLLNLVGELAVNKTKTAFKEGQFKRLFSTVQIAQQRLASFLDRLNTWLPEKPEIKRELALLTAQCKKDSNEIQAEIRRFLDGVNHELNVVDPLVDEIHDKIKDLRMIGLSQLFSEMERLARDAAHEEQKDVSIEFTGGNVEVDKKVLETIKPCLVHLVRNAVCHGVVKSGHILIRASVARNGVHIEVEDDGPGISAAALPHIFEPGFSTLTTVDSIGGRGVGLDVVKTEIEAIGGRIRVETEPGKGSRFILEAPASILMEHVLIVSAQNQKFGFPMLHIHKTALLKRSQLKSIENHWVIDFEEHTVPLIPLADLLRMPETTSSGNVLAVIATYHDVYFGFVIDDILNDQIVMVKELPATVGRLRHIRGLSILSSGEILTILHIPELIESAVSVTRHSALVTEEKPIVRVLLVEDSRTTREMEQQILRSQGFAVETAVDGIDALEKVGRGSFDVVVSDIHMPRMNGIDFCRALQANHKDLPVIFITSQGSESDRKKGLAAGAKAYIVKADFNQTELIHTIHYLTGRI